MGIFNKASYLSNLEGLYFKSNIELNNRLRNNIEIELNDKWKHKIFKEIEVTNLR